jgi:alanine racemase
MSDAQSFGEAGGLLTIDLGAIVANWRDLGRRAAGATCAAVIKADAYGTGIEATGPALARAGCGVFFVALLSEARRLRAVCPTVEIHVLNGLPPGEAATFSAHRLRPVLGSPEEIAEWAAFARGGAAIEPASIHVDTGMNRLGLTPEEAAGLLAQAGGVAGLGFAIGLVMSHFVSAEIPEDPTNARQITTFRDVRGLFPGVPGSLANSSGIFLGAKARHDLVRPGYALYGGNPTPHADNPMRNVVTLEARIVQVREVPAGEGVGYNSTWIAPRPSRIATVSVGYADGWQRAASWRADGSGGVALVEGRPAPIAGRISMDLIALDVTDLPAGLARRGAGVELLGAKRGVDAAGTAARTNGYEILTSLGRRYRRVHTGG